MKKHSDKIDMLIAWISGEVMATGVFLFSVNLAKAFMLGLVGGLGGLVVKIVWKKYIKYWLNIE